MKDKITNELYEALLSCVEQIRALCSENDVPDSAIKALAKVRKMKRKAVGRGN